MRPRGSGGAFGKVPEGFFHISLPLWFPNSRQAPIEKGPQTWEQHRVGVVRWCGYMFILAFVA